MKISWDSVLKGSIVGLILAAGWVALTLLATRSPNPVCITATSEVSAASCVRACQEDGDGAACDAAGWWYGASRAGADGPLPPRDVELGRTLWRRACGLGQKSSCGLGER